MAQFPFDTVTVKRDGKQLQMSAQEFLDMPMDERVHAILARTVEFYAHGRQLNRADALRQLRAMTSTDG